MVLLESTMPTLARLKCSSLIKETPKQALTTRRQRLITIVVRSLPLVWAPVTSKTWLLSTWRGLLPYTAKASLIELSKSLTNGNRRDVLPGLTRTPCSAFSSLQATCTDRRRKDAWTKSRSSAVLNFVTKRCADVNLTLSQALPTKKNGLAVLETNSPSLAKIDSLPSKTWRITGVAL